MKSLKKFPFILLLCFNFTQLWATENEKLEQFQETILNLYDSKMNVYKEVFSPELHQNQKSLHSLHPEIESFLSLSGNFEDPSSSYKKFETLPLLYEKLYKESEENSKKIIDFILEMDALKFEEFFKKLWINESALIEDLAPGEIEAWFEKRKKIFENGYSNLPGGEALMKDNFYPYSYFKEDCPKNPYFWLLDEMIQFLLKEESIKKLPHISECIIALLLSAKFVPLANNEKVQELYFSVWLADIIIEREGLEREERKIKILEEVFKKAKGSWEENASKFIKELYDEMNQRVNSSVYK